MPDGTPDLRPAPVTDPWASTRRTPLAGARTERPILFCGPMIRSILDGRKTQTRRVVKPQPPAGLSPGHQWFSADGWQSGIVFCRHAGDLEHCDARIQVRSPYGGAGSTLWVREKFAVGYVYDLDKIPKNVGVWYGADDAFRPPSTGDRLHTRGRWRSPIYLPRWASRLALLLVCVRVERVRAISGADVLAEGVGQPWNGRCIEASGGMTPEFETQLRDRFAIGWDAINGARSGCRWEDNPWVWVLEFARMQP